jgi:predicted O-methyltransferase YrrM
VHYLKRKLSTLARPLTLPKEADQEPPRNAFHGDKLYQQLVLTIITHFHASSFVETGTYLGETSEFVARTALPLPILTCEVRESFFRSAAKRLRKYPHVEVVEQSSVEFIWNAIEKKLLGPMPLFYLDAHWYDYWPLLDEVETITSHLSRCVMIIDDFQVPGREEFIYCVGGGGSPEFSGRTTVDDRICNFDLIRKSLGDLDEYSLLYPNYGPHDAFQDPGEQALIGYVAIFKNLLTEFESLGNLKDIKEKFKVVHVR